MFPDLETAIPVPAAIVSPVTWYADARVTTPVAPTSKNVDLNDATPVTLVDANIESGIDFERVTTPALTLKLELLKDATPKSEVVAFLVMTL